MSWIPVPNRRLLAAIIAAAGLVSVPALAQQPAATPTPTPGASTPGGVVATTNNPNLSVATVKLENGVRASKIIGASVSSDNKDKIGSVDDIILTDGNKATVAIISVGGFLGIGSKLIAVPFEQLDRTGDGFVLSGATKDALNAMPSFQY